MESSNRPPYLAATVVSLAVLGLYVLTIAPTTHMWDTSEYIAAAKVLGIPHPPGNPLFVVLGRAWELLLAPFGLSVAVSINLFSAFMSAAAHGLWFLVVHHILRYFSEDRNFRLAGALVAVMVSATAFTVWNQSNVNEKVYTVSLLTIALLTWIAFRWQENLGKGRDDNLLVLMAFILALSVGNHLMAFLAAPAIGLFILMVQPRVLVNWKLYPAVVLAALAGLTIHLVLPIRAGLEPIINEAAPNCDGIGSALTSVLTYGKAGCAALSESLQRTQYDKPPMFSLPWYPELPRTPALFGAQLANYLQYFDWQWARAVEGTNVLFADLRIPFTMLFTGLGVWGALEHYRRDRVSFYYVLVLFGTLSLGLIVYLNFKYGYSMPDPWGDPDLHEVRERDYFFIGSFSVWGLWAGIGIATIWQALAHKAGEREGRGWVRASPVLLLAALPLMFNWSWATRSYDYAARDWAYNLLMSVEPYGVVFTNGDNDTFPLWYVQEVEGIRKDVTVVVTSYLNTAWYTKQLKALTEPCPPGVSAKDDPTRIICQREYEPDDRAMYGVVGTDAGGRVLIPVEEPVRTPTRGILEALDEARIDAVSEVYAPIDTDRSLAIGNIVATLREGEYLFPWQQFGLSIVSAAQGDRPVYFASSGNAARSLGVDDYLIRQGVAFKLHDRALPDTLLADSVVEVAPNSPLIPYTGSFVDQERTRLLMEEVFVHRSGLPAWDHWPDLSTKGIPHYYAWGYYALSQVAAQRAEDQLMMRYRALGDSWNVLGN